MNSENQAEKRTRFCGIISCENNRGIKDDRLLFFCSTNRNNTIQQWTEAIRKLGLQCNSSRCLRVCMLHFHPDDVTKGGRLRPGAVPSIKTRSFDPLWQTRDERTELQPLTDEVHTEVNDLLKCELINVFTEPTSTLKKSSHSIHVGLIEDTKNSDNVESNDCVEFGNHETMTTKSPTEYAEILKKCRGLEEQIGKLRAQMESSDRNSSGKHCEICSTTITEQDFGRHLCPEQEHITCEYCTNESFTSITELHQHLSKATHSPLKFYKCSECTVAFPMRKLLEIHENSHQTRFVEVSELEEQPMHKLYGCGYCDASMANLSELKTHMKDVHAKPPIVNKPLNSSLPRVCVRKLSTKQFFECYICKCQLGSHIATREPSKHLRQHVAARDTKCEICSERLTVKELLEWHICGRDNSRFREIISCEYCDESFRSLAKCVQHLDKKHPDRTMYQCPKCKRYFGTKQLRDFHEKYHPHPKKTFQCDICYRKFASKDYIKTHMMVHTGQRFLCSVCGKSLKSRRTFHLHSLSHAAPTIQCPDCPAKFRSQFSFKKHYEVHGNIKYKCNECGRTYSKTKSLNNHIRFVHEKQIRMKKHECPYCDFKFAKRNKLETHLRTHTGEKPFECEFCHNFYKYRGDLTKHMQTHVGDNIYRCDVCGKGFRYHADFKRHSFEHYKENKQKQVEAAESTSNAK